MEQNETRLNAYNRQNNDLKEENKELKQNEAKKAKEIEEKLRQEFCKNEQELKQKVVKLETDLKTVSDEKYKINQENGKLLQGKKNYHTWSLLTNICDWA